MIITIDGPAGTGKSTVSQLLAKRLNFDFLDTGAMYRAIALAAIRRCANLDDPRELAFVARHARLDFDWSKSPPGVLLNGEPVSHLLRGGEVTSGASKVAVVTVVREKLVQQQRKIGKERQNLVTEGRDQGSVVFPDAQLKIYLDATPEERARRRAKQLRQRGEIADYRDILQHMQARDSRDSARTLAPLTIPPGAIVIDTTHLSLDHVVALILTQAQQIIAPPSPT